jgi:hypothetical protein
MYAPSYKDFAPRLGFAYTPFKSGRTVLNGSAGIVFDRTVINAVNFLQDQTSFLFFNQQVNQFGSSNVRSTLANNPRLGANLAYSASLNPTPAPITAPYIPNIDSTGMPYGLAAQSFSFEVSPTLKDPYSIALSAGIQQELPGQTVLRTYP